MLLIYTKRCKSTCIECWTIWEYNNGEIPPYNTFSGERNLIVERTQEGKAIAKKQEEYKEGRPKKYTQYQLDEAMKLLETMSFSQVEKEMHRKGTKISISTLKREAKKRKMQELDVQ